MKFNTQTILTFISDEADRRMRTGQYQNKAQVLYEVLGEISSGVIELMVEANKEERIGCLQ